LEAARKRLLQQDLPQVEGSERTPPEEVEG